MSYERPIRKASDIKEVQTRWLWEPYLPFGKVTLLHGEREIGKKLFAFRLLAACTSKKHMSFDSGTFAPMNVLYMTNVENLEGFVRPKLEEAKAEAVRLPKHGGLRLAKRWSVTSAWSMIRKMLMRKEPFIMSIRGFRWRDSPASIFLQKEKEWTILCKYKQKRRSLRVSHLH